MGLWTKWHAISILPATLVFIAVAIFMSVIYKDKTEKQRRLPLQILAALILVMELVKQIMKLAEGDGYDLYALPFHYCSLFLYLLPVHAFYKGKYKVYTDAVTLGSLASLLLLMLAVPTVIYSDSNVINIFASYYDFHTVTFHGLVCLYFFMSLALKSYEMPRKTLTDLLSLAAFYAVYVIIATTLSHALDTNFHNLLRCNLEIIENVRLSIMEAVGEVLGYVIYSAVMFVGTILVGYLGYGLTRLGQKITAKIKALVKKSA